MSPEDHRKQQADAGKRLTVNNNGSTKPPRWTETKTTNTTTRKPFIAKGHDAYLKDAQDAKSGISIITLSGEQFTGRMYARDKFTITLELQAQTDETPVLRRTFYKHAIESFERVGL